MLERVGRQIQTTCFTDDLPPVQWSTLRCLAQNSANRITVTSIAAYSGVAQSSASRTVSALVKKGLVSVDGERASDRSRRLALTVEGWRLMEHDPLMGIVETVATLPQVQKAALHDSLHMLLNRLYERGNTERD
ncbi:MAG TPA: MarR family transcriptional regulator [Terriglobia bacterium]|nr:MarR family transcriptional regulator [Terriglobia bacterium]